MYAYQHSKHVRVDLVGFVCLIRACSLEKKSDTRGKTLPSEPILLCGEAGFEGKCSSRIHSPPRARQNSFL